MKRIRALTDVCDSCAVILYMVVGFVYNQSCDFEVDTCKWTQSKKGDKLDWTRNRGSAAAVSRHTGPTTDHTSLIRKLKGYYMSIGSSTLQPGDNAILLSPTINSNEICFSFWYHMYGPNIGSLNVYSIVNGAVEETWKIPGIQRSVWRNAEVTINQQSNFQIALEGIANGYVGYIAIDDFNITNGKCVEGKSPGDCNFEKGFCGWTNIESHLDQFDWIVSTGEGHAGNNGPQNDHTTQQKTGKYALIESSHKNMSAWLISGDFEHTVSLGQCINFWVYMNGKDVGHLNVYIRDRNNINHLIWGLSGLQGNTADWFNGQARITSTIDYKIVIEAVPGTGNECAIAIDDITVTNYEDCPNKPITSAPSTTIARITLPTNAAPPLNTVSINSTYYTCNFTFGKCHWLDDESADFTWKRNQGQTSDDPDTGIRGDHTTGSSGWYIYIKSAPRKLHEAASLKTGTITATNSVCLQFWYHMYGDDIGWLNVYINRRKQKKLIWTKQGTVGPRWRHGTVDISSISSFEIYLEGVVGDGERGDIGLDDLSLSEGKCPPSAECTFEENKCGWRDITVGETKWYRMNGESLHKYGPNIDHTYGTKKGYYMVAPNTISGTKITMESAEYPPTNGSCFTFWYYEARYGSSFQVKLSQKGTIVGQIHEFKGQASKWMPQRVTIQSTKTFKIVIEAIIKAAFVAIDDIEVMRGPCEPAGNCNFERDKCGYENVENDGFDWLIGSGQRTSKEAPPIDHSTGTNIGQYIFILPESREIHQTAVLRSEQIQVNDTGKCVQFWYYLNGHDVGAIELQMKVLHIGHGHRATTTWKLSGNQTKKWIKGQAPFISHGRNITLNLVGVRGMDDQGKSAIDDITVNDYKDSCPIYPTAAVPWGCNFELGMCNWKPIKNGKVEWMLVNSKSKTTADKPGKDHTTQTEQGKFIFMDWSSNQAVNDIAAIISPPLITDRPRSPYCVDFSYIAGGVGSSIQLSTIDGGERKPIKWKVGRYANYWAVQSVQLIMENGTQVVLEGVRAKSYKGSIAIDDIILSYGDCMSLDRCTFEAPHMCNIWIKWKGKLKWQRKSASTLGKDLEPPADHTFRTRYGHFMFLNTTNMPANSSRDITMRLLTKSGPSCIQFFYYMGKNAIGTDVLTVSICEPYAGTCKRFHTTGANKGAWFMGQVSLKQKMSFKVTFKGSIGSTNHGIMAIDDYRVIDGECPPMGNCDFEQGDFCSWSEEKEKRDGFHWKIASGKSTGLATGPNVDHTIKNNGGIYAAFISKPNSSYKGKLVSPTLPATSGRCLVLWYYMSGNGAGDLNIYLKRKDKVNTLTLTTLSGNQGSNWYKKEIGLYSPTEFKVIIEGVSSGSSGVIAIDDINIKDGNCIGMCSLLPATARIACGPSSVTAASCVETYGCCYDNSHPSSPPCFHHPLTCKAVALPHRVSCGSMRISKQECEKKSCCYDENPPSSNNTHCYKSHLTSTLYDCTFENGQCNYINMKDNQFDWKRHQGSTISTSTGPKSDHTLKNNKGWYMYFKASNHKSNAIANLQTPDINFLQGDNKVCIGFWFHMYGQHVNRLNVFVTTNNAKLQSPLWYRKGQIADKWNYAQVHVSRKPAFRVTFQGVRGNGYLGDIAIDDVTFINGQCPPTMLCDFENDDLCGWSQDAGAELDWLRGSGNTSSSKEIRPATDHSYQTAFGKYMYIDGKNHKRGEKARLESFENSRTESSCVEFYYYMKGEAVGTLSLWVRRGKDLDKAPAWTLSGNQGGMWNRAFVTVKETQKWRVILEGIPGRDDKSVIAIDDVHFRSGKCAPIGDCAFEDNNLCGYQNNPKNTIDWTIHTGHTTWHKTGPSTDHTTGLITGHYIYIHGSNFNGGRKGEIISEIMQVNHSSKWCVKFWFHMYGDGVEALRVYTRHINGTGDKFVYKQIFEETGNHDDKWNMGQVNITITHNFQIVFEGEPSNGLPQYDSIIAIDDITLSDGLCSAIPVPPPNPCAVRCKNGKCISSDKVCDFFPDCAQGDKSKDDDTDERECDQCDFENGICKWKDISKGEFNWTRTQAGVYDKKTKRHAGPAKDHTKGTTLGYYIYADAKVGKMHDLAVLEGAVIKQASSTCALNFWYHMVGEHPGDLYVYILYGVKLTLLLKMSGNKGDRWNEGTAYVNRRVEPFKIKLEVVHNYGPDGDIALDDIKFVNCSLPQRSTSCPVDHFHCGKTKACIPLDRRCDFTDDCGDGTDERGCTETQFPYRCNFESDLCSWENIPNDRHPHNSFILKRGVFMKDNGAYFDHTTHTVSGQYIYAGGLPGTTIQLGSSLLKETTDSASSSCQIRFYYYFFSREDSSSFRVKTRDKTRVCEGCKKDTIAWTLNKTIWYKWIRQTVPLKSATPFQVIFELDTGKKGYVLIDDVSFYGCSMFNGTLPTRLPTTTATVVSTTQQRVCHRGEFYCKKDNKCIDRKYKCDYQADCSDGEDEASCGPCDFEVYLCGYTSNPNPNTSSASFVHTQPIPRHQNEPATDHTLKSKSGHFVVTRRLHRSQITHTTMLRSPKLSKTSSTCVVEFYYYYNANDIVALSVLYKYNGYDSVLLRQTLSSSKLWQRILVRVGSRPPGWTLELKAYDNGIALDDIKFHNCSFPRPTKTCNKYQAKCNDGGCINSDQICDLSSDCLDGSDESSNTCKTYKERCNFEKDLCHWHQDKDDGFDWSRGTGKTTCDNAPAFDHTSGMDNGFFIFVKTRKSAASQTAKLTSVVFKVSTSKCQMRFFYRMSGKHIETLWVKRRTISNSNVKMEVASKIQGDQDDMWKHATVILKTEENFQVVIEAEIGSRIDGGIAIDDISFSPGCQPDLNATLIPEPRVCKDGGFSCGDGQCISKWKVCNFVADCRNKADESKCRSSCDYEEGDTCRWNNDKTNIMDWSLIHGLTPSEGIGPTFDHTKKNKDGHFIYIETNQPNQENYFPFATFVSPTFNHASYVCKFSFWYINHAKGKEKNDAQLYLLYRRKNKDTILFANTETTGNKWKQGVAELPRCPDHFKIVFLGKHYWNTTTRISIDDWKFECAEKPPTACKLTTEFQCQHTKQCIPKAALCDMDRNCCDGSDESESSCKGYTKVDFESGFEGWSQLKGDDFDFQIESGETASVGTGPSNDHTFQEAHGKYIHTEAFDVQVNQTAMIASPPISATFSSHAPACVISFWYNMYGKYMGKLALFTATYYGVPDIMFWNISGDQGKGWNKASVVLSSNKDFQVIFVATIGKRYLSDIALDDISLSPGCNLKKKHFPGAPTPSVDPCSPLFQCKSNGKCIPRNQLCDFAKDCPDGTDENNITCGYPLNFQNGFGAWENALDKDFVFTIHHGASAKTFTGLATDARGDNKGTYIYLKVNNRAMGGKAVLVSPTYKNAYSNCFLKFSYYMYGKDVGTLQISLNSNHTKPTYLFDLRGDQGNKWIDTYVSIGRRRYPFKLDFIASVGGGDEGDIAIDEINFFNCSLPPACGSYDHGKFKCKNNLCIDKSKLCNFVDDCGDASDEAQSVCSNYIGFDFEHITADAFNITQDSTDDFDWTLNSGPTPSANTGPTHDHTFKSSDGHYMYIEASRKRKGVKARLLTSPMNASRESKCLLTFYYHMNGKDIGELNIYTLGSNGSKSEQLEMKVNGDHGFQWKQAVVDLSNHLEQFSLIFEGVIGNSFQGDTAIDDIIISPGCLTNTPRIFPSPIMCKSNEFSCNSNGNCVPGTTVCNDNRDCKDGSDEDICPDGRRSKRGDSGLNSKYLAAGIVGTVVFLLIVIATTIIWIKRRREKHLHLFSVFYNSKTPDVEQNGKVNHVKQVSITEGVANPVYFEQPNGVLPTGNIDTDAYNDCFQDDEYAHSATSMGNPLYQDPYTEEDESPLSQY